MTNEKKKDPAALTVLKEITIEDLSHVTGGLTGIDWEEIRTENGLGRTSQRSLTTGN
jgi:bacteriocin-like protein